MKELDICQGESKAVDCVKILGVEVKIGLELDGGSFSLRRKVLFWILGPLYLFAGQMTVLMLLG